MRIKMANRVVYDLVFRQCLRRGRGFRGCTSVFDGVCSNVKSTPDFIFDGPTLQTFVM